MERLACGCLVGTVGDTFVIEPCDGRCDVFVYAVRQSAAIGHPIDLIDASQVNL